MYKITVRDTKNNIICERTIMEPPSKAVFDELSREVACDCYVDVCRVIVDHEYHEEVQGFVIGFEDEVEFELLTNEEQEELA